MAGELLSSLGHVLLWISLSSGVILFNKYILSELGFPYPVALTMIHMLFCSFMANVALRVFKVCSVPDIKRQEYARKIVPVGLLFSLSLWLSNSAYIYLSVSFIQMLKALSPVVVFLVTCFAGQRRFNIRVLLNMFVIATGVVIASYGEINFVWLGFFMQLCGILTEACRLVLVQILLSSEDLRLNSITTMYFVSPVCLLFLTVPFLILEWPLMATEKQSSSQDMLSLCFVLLFNALCAFCLNVSVYMLIGKTSALTMNIAGVIKDWLLIGFSNVFFHAPISALQIRGYLLAFLGVYYYNRSKQ